MIITCLDLEGVLVPEIWIAFADTVGIPELRRTTRDEPDYDKLMKYRIAILKEHGLGLKEIQETIKKIDPLPGAKKFLDELLPDVEEVGADRSVPVGAGDDLLAVGLGLSDVDGDGYDIDVVVLLEPVDVHRGVESSGVSENDLVALSVGFCGCRFVCHGLPQ